MAVLSGAWIGIWRMRIRWKRSRLSGCRMHPLRHVEVFEYLGIPEAAVSSALRSFYGQQ